MKNFFDEGFAPMKYILVIGDGMADYPVNMYGGKTPLEVADHPWMDKIASAGICGTIQTIPKGMDTGSDVAILSILGYNPKKYHSGRGPLEAVGVGIKLKTNDIAFRCNLITEENGFLKDYSAGHIETKEAEKLINFLNNKLGKKDEIFFYKGVGYRHILILTGKKFSEKVVCTPPHDAVGKKISEILIKPASKSAVKTAEFLNRLMFESKNFLSNHPINLRRIAEGKNPANMVWFWSPGKKPRIPSFKSKFGVKGAVISAVNIVKGIGACLGFKIVKVPGITGYFDTNYEGKADYTLKTLKTHDFVLVHVEAPDEAGHLGDFKLKVKTIEDLDKRLIGRIMKNLKEDYTIAVLADHATPIQTKTHTRDPVPFAVYSTLIHKKDYLKKHFSEKEAKKSGINLQGTRFMPMFLKFGKHGKWGRL